MKVTYTRERNVQMLISILKHNNIKKVIASPGTTNMAFVASIQNDPYFEVYSCVDERSACYMACGLSVESGEPVVLTCTGATASRNYMPGLTEAFYRKIPILAVTTAQHFSKIGNNVPQSLDRTTPLNDIVNLSVQVPIVNTKDDEIGCNQLLNKAILELKRNGGGPVHINIVSSVNALFDVEELPATRYIDRITIEDQMPSLDDKKVGIFVGAHRVWSTQLTKYVDSFCGKYNAVVLCDHTSNYHGEYRILANLVCDQDKYSTPLNDFDVLVYIGDVSGAYLKLNAKEVWRVNPDGEIRDPFTKLRYIFEMSEENFFSEYSKETNRNQKNNKQFNEWKTEFNEIQKEALSCELPLSNLFVARNLITKMPNNSTIHLAILNSLRSWNYFDTPKTLNVYSNTGGFGIDGPLSTLIGASLNNPTKNYYGVVGDLAFFYDLNSLGNRNVKNNLRIILINNGCGTEFHNYSHPASLLGDMTGKFIAADGHFGNKSPELVKQYVENLGFEYISASNKEEVLSQLDYFTSEEIYERPIIFEIYTDQNDESKALKTIRNLKTTLSGTAKDNLKKILSPQVKSKIKKLIGK